MELSLEFHLINTDSNNYCELKPLETDENKIMTIPMKIENFNF